MLLPGLGAQASMWSLVVDELAADGGADVVFGPALGQAAAGAPGGRSLQAIGTEVAEQLSALELGRFVVAAHSLGTFLAVDVVRRLGPAASAAVLVNGGLAFPAQLVERPLAVLRRHPEVALATAATVLGVCLPVPVAVKRCVARSNAAATACFGPVAGFRLARDRDRRDALVELLGHPEITKGLVANRHLWRWLAEDAAEVRVPVEVISGTRDPLAPEASVAELCALLPTAHRTEIEGAHHVLPLEAPGAVAGAIRSMLEATGSESAAEGARTR